MIQEKSITCIACPRGCRLLARVNYPEGKESGGGELLSLEGNRCLRGKEWLHQEVRRPMRTLTTTVRTGFSSFPRLPVRTARDIPLGAFFEVMERIDHIRVEQPLNCGDVVQEAIYSDESGPVALIATASVEDTE